MIEFKDRLKEIRIKNGLTQTDLAKTCNVTRGIISHYESGTRKPSFEMLELIADVFNVDMDYLLGKSNIENAHINDRSNQIDLIKIPLYEDIACGEFALLDEDIIDMITLPSTILNKNKEYFANYAKGDSMIDRGIKEGDLLFFEKTNTLENGQVGAFCYEDEATCKVYRSTSNGIVLMPANDKYEPIFVTNNNFRVIGKLVYKLSKEN